MPFNYMSVARTFLSHHLLPSVKWAIFSSVSFQPDIFVSPQIPKQQSLPTMEKGSQGYEPNKSFLYQLFLKYFATEMQRQLEYIWPFSVEPCLNMCIT